MKRTVSVTDSSRNSSNTGYNFRSSKAHKKANFLNKKTYNIRTVNYLKVVIIQDKEYSRVICVHFKISLYVGFRPLRLLTIKNQGMTTHKHFCSGR